MTCPNARKNVECVFTSTSSLDRMERVRLMAARVLLFTRVLQHGVATCGWQAHFRKYALILRDTWALSGSRLTRLEKHADYVLMGKMMSIPRSAQPLNGDNSIVLRAVALRVQTHRIVKRSSNFALQIADNFLALATDIDGNYDSSRRSDLDSLKWT
jgi:hypothetical protein